MNMNKFEQVKVGDKIRVTKWGFEDCDEVVEVVEKGDISISFEPSLSHDDQITLQNYISSEHCGDWKDFELIEDDKHTFKPGDFVHYTGDLFNLTNPCKIIENDEDETDVKPLFVEGQNGERKWVGVEDVISIERTDTLEHIQEKIKEHNTFKPTGDLSIKNPDGSVILKGVEHGTQINTSDPVNHPSHYNKNNIVWYEGIIDEIENPCKIIEYSNLYDLYTIEDDTGENYTVHSYSVVDIHEHYKQAEQTFKTHDMVNHPAHYNKYTVEVIDSIENISTPVEFKGYLKGNITKYITRFEDKNGSEDLKKARFYLNRLIEVQEAIEDIE